MNGMILILILLIFPFLDGDIPRCPSLCISVLVYLNTFALPEHLRMIVTSIVVTNAYLPNSCQWNHELHKAFSKFYSRHFELIEKYHVYPKKLLQKGISNPELYGELVYKLKKIIGNPNFSDLFERRFNRSKK